VLPLSLTWVDSSFLIRVYPPSLSVSSIFDLGESSVSDLVVLSDSDLVVLSVSDLVVSSVSEASVLSVNVVPSGSDCRIVTLESVSNGRAQDRASGLWFLSRFDRHD
jgi:hypothetical protein